MGNIWWKVRFPKQSCGCLASIRGPELGVGTDFAMESGSVLPLGGSDLEGGAVWFNTDKSLLPLGGARLGGRDCLV